MPTTSLGSAIVGSSPPVDVSTAALLWDTDHVLMQHHGHDVPATPAYLRNHNVRPADVLASMDRIIRATSEVVEFMERWEREQ